MLIEYLSDRKELLPELAQLHFSEWGHFRPGQSLDDRIESLKGCSGRKSIPTVLVATSGAELLGSAMLVAHDMATRKDLSPWLAGVFVKPASRNTGVATRLVEQIECEAVQLDVPKLYLFTDKEERFYSRRGWHAIETCEYGGLDVTIMAKELVA